MAFPRAIQELTVDIGKAGVNALFPNEFEYYAVTLELTDSQGNTVEYLTFPVSPESMSYNNTTLVNIKKGMSAISALDNETFQPRKIEMTGTFGRKFKILLNSEIGKTSPDGANDTAANGVFETSKSNDVNVKKAIFNAKLKTGYGTTKILEAIVEKSKGFDIYNQSHRLYLYNPALGHNWLVKVNSINFSQDRTSSNMLWKYNIQLTAIAPVEKIRTVSSGKKSLPVSTGIAILQDGLSSLVNKLKSSINI